MKKGGEMGKLRFHIFRIVFAILFLLSLTIPSSLAQERERTIRLLDFRTILGSTSPRLLEIVEVQVAENAVPLDHPFQASPDWIKDLTILVRNVSEKKITSISLGLSLYQADGGEAGLVILEIGNWSTGETIKRDEQPLYPGEYLGIRLADVRYFHFQKYLKEIVAKNDFTEVNITRVQAKVENEDR